MKGNNLNNILWLCSHYAKPDSLRGQETLLDSVSVHIIKNAGLISGTNSAVTVRCAAPYLQSGELHIRYPF